MLRCRRVVRGLWSSSHHPPPSVPILTVSIIRSPSLLNFLCSLECESSVFMRKMHRGSGAPASLQSPDADNVLHPAFHVFVPAASALWACNSSAVL